MPPEGPPGRVSSTGLCPSLVSTLSSGPSQAPPLLRQVRSGDHDGLTHEAGLRDEIHGWCTPAQPVANLPAEDFRLVR